MVSAAIQLSLLKSHGSHSPGPLFALSLVYAVAGFPASWEWSTLVQLALWETQALGNHCDFCCAELQSFFVNFVKAPQPEVQASVDALSKFSPV